VDGQAFVVVVDLPLVLVVILLAVRTVGVIEVGVEGIRRTNCVVRWTFILSEFVN
jgi:hypothetical protein